MTTTSKPGNWAFEKEMDIARLEEFVNGTVQAMAVSTSLKAEEVLDILENIQVEMVGELRVAVEVLDNTKVLTRVDSRKLAQEIEKTIEAISNATALDTDEITEIFSDKPGASLADVTLRLHQKSLDHRERCS
ncbi:MAG: hypothetical protein HY306_08855 [Nitrosomonadales bacterium]|nr:hypothetical protein [Nitrosomonadales bacterium]